MVASDFDKGSYVCGFPPISRRFPWKGGRVARMIYLPQVRGGSYRQWAPVVMVAMRASVTWLQRVFISAQEATTAAAAFGT